MQNAYLRFQHLGKEETVTCPVLQGVLGEDVIDIHKLQDYDCFSYDPGYRITASCSSAITFIDGDKGVLLHRGYPIEQIAKTCRYETLVYLLLHGELPNETQQHAFTKALEQSPYALSTLHTLLKSMPQGTHPMALLMQAMTWMASQEPTTPPHQPEERLAQGLRLLATLPAITGAIYHHVQGQKTSSVDDVEGSYSAGVLTAMFGKEALQAQHPTLIRAFDIILSLHADHEQNASTSTVRMVGSTDAALPTSLTAGVAALWGAAHGGANEAVLSMLEQIAHVDHIPDFLEKTKDKSSGIRLMGFGHRVYKNFDPRAQIMRQVCDEVLSILGIEDDPIFAIARRLEKTALEDPFFIERKLYPNVDFYSGIVLRALGIPTSMFTVIFALARSSGWISQWLEMHTQGFAIHRPRQLYQGAAQRDLPGYDAQKNFLDLSK